MRKAAALALALAALAGCGPEDDLVERRPMVGERAASPELGASPGRAALSWWDAARARDTEALLAPLTPAARGTVPLGKLREAMDGGFGQFAEQSEANVLYTERSPGRATVYMRINGGHLVGSRLIKGGALNLALPLVARDGSWLIENAAWLRGQAESYVAIRDLRAKMRREALRQAREEEEGR